jgi:hypothetical protein
VRFFRLSFAAAVLVLVVSVAAIAGTSASQAQSAEAKCVVGGPPTIEGEPNVLEKPAGPKLVIACGKSVVGPFEIVAYDDVKESLCTFVLGEGFGDGECGEAFHESFLARDGFLITGTNWAWGHGPGHSLTSINGRVEPGVARVEVRYHRKHGKASAQVDATIGQVEGELLGKLDQTAPFGRFAVVLPECVVPQDLRILAFDSEGRMIGSEHGQKSHFGGSPCRPEGPGSSDAGGGT